MISVVAGSQAVPDDLQKIHSLSRELQQNQTQLTLRVNTIAAQISNLSQQVLLQAIVILPMILLSFKNERCGI